MDPLSTKPPDDTGTDTLQRFFFQACVAIPFCLKCAAGDQVISVIMEHFEDILVEYSDEWHFCQVKSRNERLGPWSFKDTMIGMTSLYRSYNATKDVVAKYILLLEGELGGKNPLNVLVDDPRKISQRFVRQVAKTLNISDDECRKFLERVKIVTKLPQREHIKDSMISLMGEYAPSMSTQELNSVHSQLVNMILTAMRSDQLGPLLPLYIQNPNIEDDTIIKKIEAKRLTRPTLLTILTSVTAGGLLIVERGEREKIATKLVEKLIKGGASETIIKDAKNLRANASFRETQIRSASLYSEEQLEDTRNRLRISANAIIQNHLDKINPANNAWHELFAELKKDPKSNDPHKIYNHDPHYQLGAICQITDECDVCWSVIDA